MTKNIKLTNWFIIIFSSIVISAILWNTYIFVQNFKNEERNKMELWSLATLELVSAEGEISNLTLEVLKKNTTTPMIKIDSDGSIEINNIPDLDINDTIQINKHVTLNYFVKVLPTLTRRNRESLVSQFVICNLISLGIKLKILIKILSNTSKR